MMDSAFFPLTFFLFFISDAHITCYIILTSSEGMEKRKGGSRVFLASESVMRMGGFVLYLFDQ